MHSGLSMMHARRASEAVGLTPSEMALHSLIESATSESLHGEANWDVNTQIIDAVKRLPTDAPFVLESLSKHIRSRNHAVGLSAVILLDALMTNGIPSIHAIVATRDFLEGTLVKSLPRAIRKPGERPSLNSLIHDHDIKSPLAIKRSEKVLACIQAWARAFDAHKYPIFNEVLRMLERRGVVFPQEKELEENVPVFLPEKPRQPASSPQSVGASSSSSVPASGGVGLSANAERDIKSAIETAQILTDMINNSDAPLTQDELVSQLHTTCRSLAAVLNTRLTRAANGEGEVDETAMMRLLSAHEAVQTAIQLYTDVASGVRKPNKQQAPAQQGATSSRHPQQRTEESKDDEEFAQRDRPSPVREATGRGYAAPASVQAPLVQSTPVKTRKPSDLPVELSQFDMLGLSASPPVVQARTSPSAPLASPPVALQIDPFASFPSGGTSSSLAPLVTSTPMAQTPVAATAPNSITVVSPTTGTNLMTPVKARAAIGALAPPPSSTSTRSRRKNTGTGETPYSTSNVGSPLSLASSPHAGAMTSLAATSHATPVYPPPQQSAFDFFSLDPLASQPAPSATSTAAAAAGSPFGAAPSAAVPASSNNVFDPFPTNSPPIAAAPAHRPANSNPFEAFDQDDPFA